MSEDLAYIAFAIAMAFALTLFCGVFFVRPVLAKLGFVVVALAILLIPIFEGLRDVGEAFKKFH